ncbi:MAG: ornithine cyclodeaminase family protein [Candidatus Anammoxibacter sp.]
MKTQTLLYLARGDVEKTGVTILEIINALDDMFKEKGAGNTEMPPKPGIHPGGDSFIHAMPAYIPKTGAAGIKWVAGYPENIKKNLPYVTGLMILNDPNTGLPLSVMDCTWITAKRTGAATAVAAKYLARGNSETVGIVACGVQGRSNLEALSCIFKINKAYAYDISYDRATAYAKEMEELLEIEIEPVKNLKDAVSGHDLVVTSGPILKNPDPMIEPGWLDEGAFACPLDFDSYWKGTAFAQADKLATDDKAQLDFYRGVGYFGDTPVPYADIGEIAAGNLPGRQSDNERIISVHLGLALEDVTAALIIYKRAIEMGIGKKLPL